MVKCEYCGFENPEGYIYCMHCSKKLDSLNKENDYQNNESSVDNDLRDLYYSFLNPDEKIDTSNNETHNNIPIYDKPLNIGKNQFKALILSTLVCGIGYFYLGNIKKGLLFFFSQIFLLIFAWVLFYLTNLSIMVTIMYIAFIIIYLINIYDTLIESNKKWGDYND